MNTSRPRTRSRARQILPMLQELESRTLLTATVAPVANVTVPQGKTLFVPITGTNTAGTFLNYSVATSNPSVAAQVLTGDTWLTLNVSFGAGINGTMVFELFNTIAPITAQNITNLVNQGFYKNLTFHPVFAGSFIQTGDPGNSTGGPGFTFDDEFNPLAIFSGNGQLAMSNTGKDTNGSQFIITIGAHRDLDFNNTIFGQLVEGFAVRDAIAATPVDTNSVPLQPVSIISASVSAAPTDDAVLLLTSTGPLTQSQVTVTATDAFGQSAQQQFLALVQPDFTNDPPILGPVTDQATTALHPVTFTLTSTDLEHDDVMYEAQEVIPPGGIAHASVTLSRNQVTVIPFAGFSGNIQVLVGVAQVGSNARGSTPNGFDTQVITVSADSLPTGSLDSATSTTLTGWAWDPDAGTSPIAVRIDVDGKPIATITASQERDDLTSTFVGSPDHGFTFTLPATITFGPHTVTAFALDDLTGQPVLFGTATIQTQPALFNEAWYDATNLDVAAAIRSGAMPSGWFHYLHYGQQEGRDPSAYFDEQYYRATNPDVVAAIQAGQFQSGFEHYIMYGQFEPSRNPTPFFNEEFYRLNNPDVATAVADGIFVSGYQHFLLYGSLENRVPSTLFNPIIYLQKNPDVALAVDSGLMRSAWDHFMLYGRFEGRMAV